MTQKAMKAFLILALAAGLAACGDEKAPPAAFGQGSAAPGQAAPGQPGAPAGAPAAFGAAGQEAGAPATDAASDPAFHMPSQPVLDVEPAAEKIIEENWK